jgi:hypothetical protein
MFKRSNVIRPLPKPGEVVETTPGVHWRGLIPAVTVREPPGQVLI